MIHIILISHGPFCEGLLASLNMITGEQEAMSAVALQPGETAEHYRGRLKEEIDLHYQDQGIMVLCDITGGTPYNSIGYLARDYKVGLITGMNLPMAAAMVLERDEDSTLEDLLQIGIDPENAGIKKFDFKKGGKKREKLSINQN